MIWAKCQIRKILTVGLEGKILARRDWRVTSSSALDEARQIFDRERFSLVLVNLEDFREIRTFMTHIRLSQDVPIIALGKSEGSYDWPVHREADLFLPFETPPWQLIAYISAILQIHENHSSFLQPDPSEGWPICQGDFFVDRVNCQAVISGKAVSLYEDETNLLVYFLLHTRRVLLHHRVNTWMSMNGCGADESLVVADLRKKIEPDPKTPVYIQTIPGVGYCFYDRAGTV